VTNDVASDFASTGGVAKVNRLLQVDLFDELCVVIGVGVQIVVLPRLAGATVTAAGLDDATESVRGENEHLRFPSVRRKRPSMAEDCGLSEAPILEIDLHTVLGGDHGHRLLSFL
jgi:hypothetical protein